MAFKNKQTEGRMAQWLEILSTFDFEIQYCSGRKHQNADSLSRRPSDINDCNLSSTNGICCGVFLVAGWDHDVIQKAQCDDPILAPVMRWLRSGVKQRPAGKEVTGLSGETKSLWFQWDQLLLRDGLLYRKIQFKNRSVAFQLVIWDQFDVVVASQI